MIQTAINVKLVSKFICMYYYVLVLPYWFNHANQAYEKTERKERGGYTLVSLHFPTEKIGINHCTSFFDYVAHHFVCLNDPS